MHLKRAMTFVVVGGACAAWLAAAATSRRDVQVPAVRQPAPPDPRAERLESEIARLHERLQPASEPRLSARNPFEFTAARKPRPAPRAVQPAAAPAAVVPVAVPEASLFKLDGIAEDGGPDGPVRTAILSSGQELFLVKEGESIATRFRVLRIGSEAVEIGDAATGSVLRVALR